MYEGVAVLLDMAKCPRPAGGVVLAAGRALAGRRDKIRTDKQTSVDVFVRLRWLHRHHIISALPSRRWGLGTACTTLSRIDTSLRILTLLAVSVLHETANPA